jgi:hypothetical protein
MNDEARPVDDTDGRRPTGGPTVPIDDLDYSDHHDWTLDGRPFTGVAHEVLPDAGRWDQVSGTTWDADGTAHRFAIDASDGNHRTLTIYRRHLSGR